MSTPLRVLIVEDSEDSCLLIQAVLEQNGFEPVWQRVADAETLRHALTTERWDIGIADYVVPGFDAFASLPLARETAPDLPFIVVSGTLGEEVAVAVMKAGAQDFISKNNLIRLVPAIQRELREAQSRQARQAAEAALRDKAILSRAVLDSLPAEVAVLTQEGLIQASNAAWDRLAQAQARTRGVPVAKTYAEFFRRIPSVAGETKLLTSVQRVLAGTLSQTSVEYARQGSSGMRWVLLQVTPLIDSGGAVLSQIDITESKRAEEALRQSETRFRDVVESLGEGLLLTDPNDMIWYANSRLGELVGCDPSEMIERSAAAFFRNPAQKPGEPDSNENLGLPRVGRTELELFHRGNALWVEVNAAPLRDSQGREIGTVRAITDVTERRQAREALRKSQASLLLAQRIGRVGSWELDLTTRTMEWSTEAHRLLDAKIKAAQPTLDDFLILFHPEDQPKVKSALEEAIRGCSSFRTDCRLLREGGNERFLLLQAQVILDVEEKPLQMIGTVQDITERRLLDEQLRQSQKMEAVGKLAGGIAHDFNNILTVIQGYTELIGYQPDLDPQTRTYAKQISVSADRASKLTRQLLAFSRKQVMQLKSLNLNEMLSGMASMLQRLLGEQSQLTLNLQPELPRVTADVGMMEQVLVNLVVNARDAMPKGGRLIVETSSHQIDPDYCRIHADAVPGQFICLSVVDTGCGMDAEVLSHIFEPFFTTKDVGRGTGLGLSTVYGIVKQHQGWIQVASEPGRGTAFKLFLPFNSPPPSGAPYQARPAAVTGGTETILLVEDEGPLRKLARSILERCGYRIVEAGSGPEALKVWSESPAVDLLLTDMVMPGGMNGRELATKLREQLPTLKVLYTSGYSLEFVEGNLLLREGINFVPKPYSGTSLTEAVRQCLDRKEP